MIRGLFVFLGIFILFFVTSSDPYFGISLTWKPEQIPKQIGDVKELHWRSPFAFKKYLHDYQDRVADEFKVVPYFYPMVNFWFLIYTQFNSSQIIVHDKNNPYLIYKVLDFSSLHTKGLSNNTLYVLRNKIVSEKLENLKNDLSFMSKNPLDMGARTKNIITLLKNAHLNIPQSSKERSKFYLKLIDGLRTQTGQKNFIRDGLVRSLPYRPFLTNYFKAKNLPVELIAIPFLESSFNPNAESKVNALGAWQFMPLIASYFVPPRTGQYDYRSNIGVASVSAAHLMKENFSILKSWDLAVTAYNSGTKHLLKTKRALKTNRVTLEQVIKHSDSRHFGFASKNFYSEFLALAHTIAYREELFNDLHKHDRLDVHEMLEFYQSKCSVNLKKLLNTQSLDDVAFHNDQLDDLSKQLPRGLIVTAKSPLPETYFKKIPSTELLNRRPKDWFKNLNQSCSTK